MATGPAPTWRAFLFDLDGTLVDSSALHARAFREVLAAEAPALLERFDYPSVMGMETGAAFERLGVRGEAMVASLRDAKRRRFRELAHAGLLAEMPGARALLTFVRERGARAGVVTSASAGSAALSLRASGLAGLVDFVVTAEDAARAKPHPDLFLRGLERAGARTEDAVAIEDAPAGALAARAAGLTVLGVHDARVAAHAEAFFETLERLREYLQSAMRRPVE